MIPSILVLSVTFTEKISPNFVDNEQMNHSTRCTFVGTGDGRYDQFTARYRAAEKSRCVLHQKRSFGILLSADLPQINFTIRFGRRHNVLLVLFGLQHFHCTHITSMARECCHRFVSPVQRVLVQFLAADQQTVRQWQRNDARRYYGANGKVAYGATFLQRPFDNLTVLTRRIQS